MTELSDELRRTRTEEEAIQTELLAARALQDPETDPRRLARAILRSRQRRERRLDGMEAEEDVEVEASESHTSSAGKRGLLSYSHSVFIHPLPFFRSVLGLIKLIWLHDLKRATRNLHIEFVKSNNPLVRLSWNDCYLNYQRSA